MEINAKLNLKAQMAADIQAMQNALDLVDDEDFGGAMDIWTRALMGAKRTSAEIAKAKFAGGVQ